MHQCVAISRQKSSSEMADLVAVEYAFCLIAQTAGHVFVFVLP